MMNNTIKKRLKRLANHYIDTEIICFVFQNSDGGWYVKWNDSKTEKRRDGFQSVDEALEFAESLNNVSDIFYHDRAEIDFTIIVDAWGGENET